MLGLSVGLGIGTGSVISGGGAAAVTLSPTTGFNKYSGITLSNGNLTELPDASGNYQFVRATRAANTGAVEAEFTVVNSALLSISVEDGTQDFSVGSSSGTVVPGNSGTTGLSFFYTAGNGFISFLYNSGTLQSPACTINATDKLTVQMDKGAGTLKLLLNGTQLGTTVTGLTWTNWYIALGGKSPGSLTANFAGSFSFGANAAY